MSEVHAEVFRHELSRRVTFDTRVFLNGYAPPTAPTIVYVRFKYTRWDLDNPCPGHQRHTLLKTPCRSNKATSLEVNISDRGEDCFWEG